MKFNKLTPFTQILDSGFNFSSSEGLSGFWRKFAGFVDNSSQFQYIYSTLTGGLTRPVFSLR